MRTLADCFKKHGAKLDPGYKKDNLPRLEKRFTYVLDGMVAQGWLEKEKAAKIKFPAINARVTSGALAGPLSLIHI